MSCAHEVLRFPPGPLEGYLIECAHCHAQWVAVKRGDTSLRDPKREGEGYRVAARPGESVAVSPSLALTRIPARPATAEGPGHD